MEHALRVAAYCRVSTDKEDQLHSLAAQQAYFEGYIARHGWRCAGIFADEGLSGTSAGPDSPSCSGWPGRGRWI